LKVVTSSAQMQKLAGAARLRGKTIAFVPTMGYLHAGHARLLKVGRRLGDVLVLSIFVNPMQFGPKEDLSRYPRDFRRDSKIARAEGTDIIFKPGEMYPPGFQTHIEVEKVTTGLCGEFRPGHFTGVTTIVAKLFNVVKPHFAVFGTKDLQQLVSIKRMVRDLDMDVKIIPVLTVREADGLAMSSRNAYLSPDERTKAVALPNALKAAKALARSGVKSAGALKSAALKALAKEPAFKIQYLEVVDPDTLEPVKVAGKGSVMAVAAYLGKTRLIDNLVLA
jgi:pantoate--beta-alanine ligase